MSRGGNDNVILERLTVTNVSTTGEYGWIWDMGNESCRLLRMRIQE